ncbi:hypothetical protein D3C72_1814250 [compost metagenome]
MPTPVHLLDQHVVADFGISTQIPAVAIGDGHLEGAALPAQQLVQVHRGAHYPLIRVASQFVRAAAEVVRGFAGVAKVQGNALHGQFGTHSPPVTEQVGRRRQVVGVRRTYAWHQSDHKQTSQNRAMPGARACALRCPWAGMCCHDFVSSRRARPKGDGGLFFVAGRYRWR